MAEQRTIKFGVDNDKDFSGPTDATDARSPFFDDHMSDLGVSEQRLSVSLSVKAVLRLYSHYVLITQSHFRCTFFPRIGILVSVDVCCVTPLPFLVMHVPC